MSVQATAIILARAGSKGLPHKNRRMIAGKPCAQWTVEHALASASISRVIVSTDDAQLIELLRDINPAPTKTIEYIHRPADLAQDNTPIDAAARHAATESNISPDSPIAILYANVPVRPADLTDRAITLLTETACDSVQSYCAVDKHHPLWTCRVSEDGSVQPWQGDTRFNNIFRRQDLPPAHIPDGGVIALTHAALFRPTTMQSADSAAPGATGGLPASAFSTTLPAPPSPHAFLGDDHRAITTEPGDVIDIDNEIDALVAEQVLHLGHPFYSENRITS